LTTSSASVDVEASPSPLSDFAIDARQLDDAAFASRHGSAFLVHHGAVGGMVPARRWQGTQVIEGPAEPDAAIEREFVVFAVRASGRSSFPGFISIGRTRNNDVVVNDVSVSKFHAFCREGNAGIELQDAGSANGTFVNEEAVPRKGEGQPRSLAAGDSVRLGNVRFTFLFVPELKALASRLCR
jgi:hypothetical protein